MPRTSHVLFTLIAALTPAGILTAQQQPAAPATAPAAQPVQPQAPFHVDPAHQAWLDQVLTRWQQDSAKVNTFYCDFERDVHNMLGPADGRPFSKQKGKLGYTNPDKGSFQITEVKVWKQQQAPPAPNAAPAAPQPTGEIKGSYEIPKDANGKPEPGEHWVCSGKNVYEYRRQAKELVVRPIPPEMQGQRIVDGPLPFLFGADAAKLKKRFWLRPDPALSKGKFIGIHAKPKLQVNAANYSDVWVVLRNEAGKPLMPAGLRILHPNKSWDEYRFNLNTAQVNPVIAGWFAQLFTEPRTPLGWKRIVEPMQQAQQPQGAQRR